MHGHDQQPLEHLLEITADWAAPRPGSPVVGAPERVLIVGMPRSGSTFLARALARTADTSYFEEPDNGDRSVSACRGLRNRGLQPALLVDEECGQLERCFAGAFVPARRRDRVRTRIAKRLSAPYAGARRVMCADPARTELPLRLRAALAVAPWRVSLPPRRSHVVKTVHMALSVDWLRSRFDVRLVVTRRHPLDILASWISLDICPVRHGWQMLSLGDLGAIAERFGAPPPPFAETDRAAPAVRAWVIGLLATGIERAITDHPDIVVADHEVVCREPVSELRHIARQVGLQWSDDAEQFVIGSNRPGSGYATQRVASTLPGSWRTRLEPAAIADATRVLREFPWSVRYDGIHD